MIVKRNALQQCAFGLRPRRLRLLGSELQINPLKEQRLRSRLYRRDKQDSKDTVFKGQFIIVLQRPKLINASSGAHTYRPLLCQTCDKAGPGIATHQGAQLCRCYSLLGSVNHLGTRGTPSCDWSLKLSQTRVTLLDYVPRLTPDSRLVSEPSTLVICVSHKNVQTAWLLIPARCTQ